VERDPWAGINLSESDLLSALEEVEPPPPPPEDDRDRFMRHYFDHGQRILKGENLGTTVGERWYMHRIRVLRTMRPLAIPEMGDKVRVATLHHSDEIALARRISQLWLKGLGRMVMTRQMLRNEEVVLRSNTKKAEVFSADLSKATDYISPELGIIVAEILNERLGLQDYNPDIRALLSPGRTIILPDGTEETARQGIYMGLGPTWIILSLLNSYCAWKAGANKRSYAVCGDDLVGLWSRYTANRYMNNLTKVGLVPNREKSWFAKRGVFCERMVTKDPFDHQRCFTTDVGHLSQICAAKYKFGRTKAAPGVLDGLRGIPLAKTVLEQLAPRTPRPGRIRHGGSGKGHLDLDGLANLLTKGQSLVKSSLEDRKLTEKLSNILLDRPGKADMSEGVYFLTRSESVIALKTARQYKAWVDGEKLEISHKSLKDLRIRRKNTTVADLRNLVESSEMNSRNKALARTLLRGNRLPPSSRRRLTNVFSRRKERYTRSTDLLELIRQETGLRWGYRLLYAHQRGAVGKAEADAH
jgi:hypothetical protein